MPIEDVNNNVNQGQEKNENNSSDKVSSVPKKKSADDISLKYRGLSYDLAAELYYYENKYFFWDLPVPFGDKIKLYPVNIKDYNDFMDSVSCLSLDKKNLSPNAKPEEIKKQLKMTDLDFLISKMEKPEWVVKLSKLIELTMHVETGMKCPHCGEIMTYTEYKEKYQEESAKMIQKILNDSGLKEENIKSEQQIIEIIKKAQNSGEEQKNTPTVKCSHCGGDGLYETIKYEKNEETQKFELFIDQQKIDYKDYNRLKNIILFQNLPDYRDTSYIDPALKKDYETRKKIEGQKNAKLTATIEEKLAALKVFEGLSSYEDLYKLSVRKFLIEFGKMDDLINYSLQMMGRLCGLGGGGKETPEHWIYREVKDVYADGGYVSSDTMKSKTSIVS